MLGDLLSKVLADDVHLLACLVPVGDADRRCLRATLTKEHRFADPAALRSVPRVVEVHLPEVAVGDLDGNVPARRLLINIVVAVKEAGAIGVIVVGSVPQVAPLGEFGRSEVQAFRIPNVIVVGTCSALAATPIVNATPVIEAIGADREKIKDREQLAAEGTVEGVVVEPVGVVGGVVLQIMLHPLDVLPVGLVDFDDRSPVAVHEGDGQAIIVDVLALELSSPSGGKLGVGRRVQELSSELAESNPLGGPLEGENFEDPLRRSIFVEASLLFLDPANLGVWVGAVDVLGKGHNRARRARCRRLAALRSGRQGWD